MASSNQGFAAMDEKKQRDIASKGGQTGSKVSGGNFANDKKKASDAGKRGAAAQSTEDKAKGGRNSHANL
jgi:general stress protein YciG